MTVEEIVGLYGAAWNEPDEAARRTLLERSWADDGVYCDPSARLEGRDALVAHIGDFHERMPGSRVVRTSAIDEHDGWLRFHWRLLDPDDVGVLDGMDVGTLAADGRLARIVGFFGPLATT
jgi:hypothetical protein